MPDSSVSGAAVPSSAARVDLPTPLVPPPEGALQYYQWWGLLIGAVVVAGAVLFFSDSGAISVLSIGVFGSLVGVFGFGGFLIWDRYPRRTEITAEGLVFHQRLGNSRVSWANLGPPTYNQGRWVLFKTDPKTPGFAGSPVIVDRPTARKILRSSHRNSWAVPPEFQYLVEPERRTAINSSAPAG